MRLPVQRAAGISIGSWQLPGGDLRGICGVLAQEGQHLVWPQIVLTTALMVTDGADSLEHGSRPPRHVHTQARRHVAATLPVLTCSQTDMLHTHPQPV